LWVYSKSGRNLVLALKIVAHSYPMVALLGEVRCLVCVLATRGQIYILLGVCDVPASLALSVASDSISGGAPATSGLTVLELVRLRWHVVISLLLCRRLRLCNRGFDRQVYDRAVMSVILAA